VASTLNLKGEEEQAAAAAAMAAEEEQEKQQQSMCGKRIRLHCTHFLPLARTNVRAHREREKGRTQSSL